MKTIFETERLRLREFNLNDTDFIIDLLNSPGWIKYIGDRKVKTKEDAVAYLETGPLKSYKDNGYGLAMVELINGSVPIGMSGIINRKTLDTPDIGFALLPGYEGKGYAFEIAGAIVNYAAGSLKLEKLSAITLHENSSSRKLLVKLGFIFSKNIINPSTSEELLLYTLTISAK